MGGGTAHSQMKGCWVGAFEGARGQEGAVGACAEGRTGVWGTGAVPWGVFPELRPASPPLEARTGKVQACRPLWVL